MNSLIRTFWVAAVMSLLINNITPAQRPSQAGESRPVQVGSANAEPVSEASVDTTPTAPYPYGEMMEDYGEYEYEMMMEMEDMGQYRLPDPSLRTGRKVFVIPATEIKTEDYLAIERDMHVMSLIFDRALRKPQMIGGVFTVLEDFFGRDSHLTEAIYLDGYGALFFMEVNFALLGPTESQEEKKLKEDEEQIDQIWKRAEQELYSPQDLNINRRTGSVREYEAEKVENLKNTLITVLKHAANIQALKSDELVVLTIFGRASQSERTSGRLSRSSRGRSGYGTIRSAGAKASSFSTTVVTIRTKKSDIDAFSKGELDFDQFHERTQIITHWK
jgi:hypothetical protein